MMCGRVGAVEYTLTNTILKLMSLGTIQSLASPLNPRIRTRTEVVAIDPSSAAERG